MGFQKRSQSFHILEYNTEVPVRFEKLKQTTLLLLRRYLSSSLIFKSKYKFSLLRVQGKTYPVSRVVRDARFCESASPSFSNLRVRARPHPRFSKFRESARVRVPKFQGQKGQETVCRMPRLFAVYGKLWHNFPRLRFNFLIPRIFFGNILKNIKF